MAGNKFVIPIAYKSDKTGLTQAENDLNNFGKVAKGVGLAAAAAFAAAGTAAVALGVSSIKAASDLQQSIGATETVFKDSSLIISNFANNAAKDLGLSENAYRNLATTMGAMLKNTGTPMDQLAVKTNSLITLSADLAATFGGSVVEAASAVSAALRGEADPIERYGISLKATNIEAEALAMTGKKVAASLTDEEKAAARVSLLFKQSADATGAFARESNTLAGQTERLKAQMENFKATLGTALIPALTKITPIISDFINRLVASPQFDVFLDGLSESFGLLIEALLPVLPVLSELILALLPVVIDLVRILAPVVGDLIKAFMPLIPVLAEIVKQLLPPLASILSEFIKMLVANPDFMKDSTKSLQTFAAILEPVRWTLQAVADLIKQINENQAGAAQRAAEAAAAGKIAVNPFVYGKSSGGGYQGNWGVPQMANGGVIMPRPGGTLVNVGEAGKAEAIVPLDKAGSLGTTVVINGNVGYDAVELAREIARRQAQQFSLAGLNRLVGVA